MKRKKKRGEGKGRPVPMGQFCRVAQWRMDNGMTHKELFEKMGISKEQYKRAGMGENVGHDVAAKFEIYSAGVELKF